jgi:hypothetical protein
MPGHMQAVDQHDAVTDAGSLHAVFIRDPDSE